MHGWSNEATYIIHKHFGDYFQNMKVVTPESLEETVRRAFILRNEKSYFVEFAMPSVNWQELADHYNLDDLSPEGLVND